MHNAEAVGDVKLTKRGVFLSELSALGLVLTGLALLEADVFDQGDLAISQRLRGFSGGGTNDVPSKLDVKVHKLTEALGNWRQRVLGIDGTLGTTEVREHGGASASLMQLGQSRQGSLNTAVVGDLVPVERDIEVAADDDALTAQVSEILNRFHVEALS